MTKFLLSLLPRQALDRLETGAWRIPEPDLLGCEKWVTALREMRIALVRQDVYSDLYCCNPKMSGPEIVRHSVRRTGPAGLLVDLHADYWVVKEDAAPECAIWTEKIANDPDPCAQTYRAQKDRPPGAGFVNCFSDYAVKVDEIPWDRYDLVVSIDISVPFRIIQRSRRPLWAYLPGDPGVPTAKRSLQEPPGNYDISLSHSFRRHSVRPSLGPRTVEFPYTFLRRGSWDKIFPRSQTERRRGTMVEHQTEKLLSDPERQKLQGIGPLRRPEGSILDVAERLNRSAFYFRCGGGPIVGNGIVEAAASGCLAVGNAREFVNRSLFCHPNVWFTREAGIDRILELASDPKSLDQWVGIQGRLLDYYCFYRPIREILRLWTLRKSKPSKFKGRLSIGASGI